MEFIDLKAQQQQLISEDKTLRKHIEERINAVLNHGRFILGPEVAELEKKLAQYVGVKHCIGVSSGTDALLIALLAIGIKRGDEVITTPFSFFATVETILLIGAKPVFVDIEKDSYNIDPKALKAAINKNTKAIVPVSLYGQPANFKEINKIAKNYELPVIEDGAQSFGSTHHGMKSGSLSTIGTTSFFPSKPLGGYGDGGACFTNNDNLEKKIREISLHGQVKRYTHNQIGINGRLDTIQAAIILAKMELFDREVDLRQKIGQRYTNIFNKSGFQSTPKICYGNTSVYAQYTIQVENRDKIIEELKKVNIPTSIHYPSLLNEQKALKSRDSFIKNIFKKLTNTEIFLSKSLNNAQSISKRVLSLPMHPNLEQSDQDKIIKALILAMDKVN